MSTHHAMSSFRLSTICQRVLVCAVAVMSISAQAAITNFSFPAQTGVALSSTVTSATTGALSGTGGPIPVTISPAGATFSISGGAFGTVGNINDTQTLAVQVTSSATYNTLIPVTVTIGASQAVFNVTTLIAPVTGVGFTQINNVQPSSVQTSETVTIGGLAPATSAPITISGGTYSKNGGAYVSTAGSVVNGDTLTLQLTASSSYSMLSQAAVSIGGAGFTFSVTTIPATGLPGTFTAPTALPVSISGLSSQPNFSNLSNGIGPNVATRTALMLTNALGMPLQYVSQSSQGTAVLSGFNGGNLAFMPVSVQTDNRAGGVYPVGNGQYQVVAPTTVVVTGQPPSIAVTIAPALVHLDQLLALLPGVAASLQSNGVIVATYNGVTYAVQPSAQVQIAPATGAARLFVGNDGLYRFIDAQGNSQVLYPAFADVDTMRNTVVPSMFAGGSATIQLDGTARLLVNGQAFKMGPDITLGGVPADRAGQSWWAEGANRYRMLNQQPTVAGSSQGFGITSP